MREEDPISLFSGSTTPHRTGTSLPPLPVMFTRPELNIILNLYGQHVAQGTWRDYAIDMKKDRAQFCIYQRTTEFPLYTIVKQPKLARKQGAFSILSSSGQILKRGQDLKMVLRILRPKQRPDLYVVQ